MTTAMPRPVSRARGKIRAGSLVSSTMLTESSKPTIAKKAIEVAAVTARNRPLSPESSKVTTRPKSALPWDIAKKPTPMTIARATTSTIVSSTLNFTDSPTPRRLISASSSMKAIAMPVMTPVLGSESSHPLATKPPARFCARTLEEVAALVMPEQITPKATRNVTKWMPKALWVYSAAPAARGYLHTSSR